MKNPKNTIVTVENIHKVFLVPHERRTSLKQHVLNIFQSVSYRRFEAIKNVSFEVHEGEFFSIIGQNGSGKSTLLKILAGIYTPTSGSIKIQGRLSPFIELGVGFNPELTARANIFLNGAILGLTRAEIDDKFDEILAFAELEEFVDLKLKNFSSGMLVRLAFSVAIQAHSEILLIDEVLAVGDANFQQKCFDVFLKLKAEGRTIIFVSHDLGSVKKFSDRVLLLNDGTDYGVFKADTAVAKYSQLNQERADRELEKLGILNTRPSKEGLQVKKVELLAANGRPTRTVNRGQKLSVRLTIDNPNKLPIAAGVAVYRSDGFYCFGTNTGVDKYSVPAKVATKLTLEYHDLPLQTGTYYLVVGLYSKDTKTVYQMIEHVLDFHVDNSDGTEGLLAMPHSWKVDV